MSEYICKQEVLETERGAHVSLGQVTYEPVKELIRCRDCDKLMDDISGWCYKHHEYVELDDFCSWAKPKEES